MRVNEARDKDPEDPRVNTIIHNDWQIGSRVMGLLKH